VRYAPRSSAHAWGRSSVANEIRIAAAARSYATLPAGRSAEVVHRQSEFREELIVVVHLRAGQSQLVAQRAGNHLSGRREQQQGFLRSMDRFSCAHVARGHNPRWPACFQFPFDLAPPSFNCLAAMCAASSFDTATEPRAVISPNR